MAQITNFFTSTIDYEKVFDGLWHLTESVFVSNQPNCLLILNVTRPIWHANETDHQIIKLVQYEFDDFDDYVDFKSITKVDRPIESQLDVNQNKSFASFNVCYTLIDNKHYILYSYDTDTWLCTPSRFDHFTTYNQVNQLMLNNGYFFTNPVNFLNCLDDRKMVVSVSQNKLSIWTNMYMHKCNMVVHNCEKISKILFNSESFVLVCDYKIFMFYSLDTLKKTGDVSIGNKESMFSTLNDSFLVFAIETTIYIYNKTSFIKKINFGDTLIGIYDCILLTNLSSSFILCGREKQQFNDVTFIWNNINKLINENGPVSTRMVEFVDRKWMFLKRVHNAPNKFLIIKLNTNFVHSKSLSLHILNVV